MAGVRILGVLSLEASTESQILCRKVQWGPRSTLTHGDVGAREPLAAHLDALTCAARAARSFGGDKTILIPLPQNLP